MSMTDESSAGPSQWERQLYAHLKEHVETEQAMMERLSDIAERTESKAIRYLANLLMDDEARHHRLFEELASSLETEALMNFVIERFGRLDCVVSNAGVSGEGGPIAGT